MNAFDTPPASTQRIRPWLALRGLVRVLRDPEDTEAGARFVLALDGVRPEQNFQRFAADPLGGKVLAEGRSLPAALCDRESLRALPDASLGRRYLAFMEEESISAEGLAEACEPVRGELGELDPARRLFHDRVGVMHDLWHVLLGYSRDILGELQLLAFSHVQLRTRAFGWIVPIATCFDERQAPGTRNLVALARERARRAPWFPVQDWEALLARPLRDVRESLHVGTPPVYRRYFSDPDRFGLLPEPETARGHVLAES
jgi:ubiquinone biosynthesis protein COQ4